MLDPVGINDYNSKILGQSCSLHIFTKSQFRFLKFYVLFYLSNCFYEKKDSFRLAKEFAKIRNLILGKQLITVAFDFACSLEFFTRNWFFWIAIFSDLKFLVFISQDFWENLKLKILINIFWIWNYNLTYFWLTKLEIRSKDRKDFILLDGLNVLD